MAQTIFKNISLLKGHLSDEQLSKMEHAAREHRRYNALTFKLVQFGGKEGTIIQVVQDKHPAANYFTRARLIEIVKESFGRFFPGKIKVHAVPYNQPTVQQVNSAWVIKQMSKTGTTVPEIARETDLDETQLYAVSMGNRPMSKPMKALFYYYFKSKQS